MSVLNIHSEKRFLEYSPLHADAVNTVVAERPTEGSRGLQPTVPRCRESRREVTLESPATRGTGLKRRAATLTFNRSIRGLKPTATVTSSLREMGMVNAGQSRNDATGVLVERATGPLWRATRPPRLVRPGPTIWFERWGAEARRQVAAENGQVGRSTQTQSNWFSEEEAR